MSKPCPGHFSERDRRLSKPSAKATKMTRRRRFFDKLGIYAKSQNPQLSIEAYSKMRRYRCFSIDFTSIVFLAVRATSTKETKVPNQCYLSDDLFSLASKRGHANIGLYDKRNRINRAQVAGLDDIDYFRLFVIQWDLFSTPPFAGDLTGEITGHRHKHLKQMWSY